MTRRQDWYDDFHEDFEEEETHFSGCQEHGMEFISYGNDLARSDGEGWFYDDED